MGIEPTSVAELPSPDQSLTKGDGLACDQRVTQTLAPYRRVSCAIGVSTSLAYTGSVIFLETPVFTRQIKALVDDEEYRKLQLRLVANPDCGDLIPRSGGLRKIRLGVAGRGKRGGARVVYYWVSARSQIYMLLAYAKNVQEDLTQEQL